MNWKFLKQSSQSHKNPESFAFHHQLICCRCLARTKQYSQIALRYTRAVLKFCSKHNSQHQPLFLDRKIMMRNALFICFMNLQSTWRAGIMTGFIYTYLYQNLLPQHGNWGRRHMMKYKKLNQLINMKWTSFFCRGTSLFPYYSFITRKQMKYSSCNLAESAVKSLVMKINCNRRWFLLI